MGYLPITWDSKLDGSSSVIERFYVKHTLHVVSYNSTQDSLVYFICLFIYMHVM